MKVHTASARRSRAKGHDSKWPKTYLIGDNVVYCMYLSWEPAEYAEQTVQDKVCKHKILMTRDRAPQI